MNARPRAALRNLVCIACTALAAVHTGDALADASAAATVSNIQLQVKDLDLNDGIAAGYRLQSGPSGSSSTARSEIGYYSSPGNFGVVRDEASAPLFMRDTGTGRSGISGISTSANVYSTPGGLATAVSISDARLAMVSGASSFASTFILDSNSPDGTYGLWVEPHTELTLSFDGRLQLQDAGVVVNWASMARAGLYAHLGRIGWNALPENTVDVSRTTGADSFVDTLDETHAYSIVLSNPGASAIAAAIVFSMEAYASTGLTVPEPSSALLLLCGAAGLAWRRKRLASG